MKEGAGISRRILAILLIAIMAGSCGQQTTPSLLNQCEVVPYVPAPQSGWPCPAASVLREIDAKVTLQFDVDPTAGALVCRAADGSADLTRLQERAYQALILIKELEFDSPLPWTSLSLWDWFTRSVHGIQFVDGERALCCFPGGFIKIPVAAAYNPGFPTFAFGFVHEARHLDTWTPHSCGSRDNTIDQMGAFGVQYHLGVWIAEHAISPALTVEERRHARNASDLLRSSAFCQECGG